MAESLPIVLVPGLNCSPRLYAAQMPELWRFGPVTVADHTRDDTMAAIARRILEAAPPRFALAGLSMGGYIALEIVRQAADRVAKLALLDTGCARRHAGGDRQASHQHRARRGRALRRGHRPAVPAVRPPEPRRRRGAEGRIPRDVPRRRAASLCAPAEGDHDTAWTSRPLLPAIRCPTLVLVGAQDEATPPALSDEMAAAIPGARLVKVPECGHLSTMERPEAVTRELVAWMNA